MQFHGRGGSEYSESRMPSETFGIFSEVRYVSWYFKTNYELLVEARLSAETRKKGWGVGDQLIVYGSWHSSASSFKSTAAVNTARLAKLKCRPTRGIFCSRVLKLIFEGVNRGSGVILRSSIFT